MNARYIHSCRIQPLLHVPKHKHWNKVEAHVSLVLPALEENMVALSCDQPVSRHFSLPICSF